MINNLTYHTKTRQNKNINLRMTKESKKRCWKRMGSPPPPGSKKVVLKFRSVKSIVIEPAKTGRDKSTRKAVSRTDQTKSGIISKHKPDPRMLLMVVIKLIAPRIDEIPARGREKIPKSTDIP